MADDGQRLTTLTTGHFGLAGARSQAAAESASRAALFLGSGCSRSSGWWSWGSRAINRIRHYYLEQAGETARYFMLSGSDDATGVLGNMGIAPSPWQLYFTAAIAVADVDAVIGGARSARRSP